MIYYASVGDYLAEARNDCAKLAALENIWWALCAASASASDASTATVQELMLNDGQTIVKTMYRSPEQLLAAQDDVDRQIQKFKNRLRGRTVQMKSAPNFLYGRLGWTF